MTQAASHTPQELEQILEESDLLSCCRDGTFKAMGFDGSTITINSDALADLHPLLPLAVDARRARAVVEYANTADDNIDARDVLKTAQLLRDGSIQLQSMTGRVYDVTGFKGVVMPKYDDDPVLVTCKTVILDYAEHGNIRVPFVINSYNQIVEMSQSDLTDKYPGWKDRYKVAQGLELSSAELAEYLFTINIAVADNIRFDDVNFDSAL